MDTSLNKKSKTKVNKSTKKTLKTIQTDVDVDVDIDVNVDIVDKINNVVKEEIKDNKDKTPESGLRALTRPLYPSGHLVPLVGIVKFCLGYQVSSLEFQHKSIIGPGTSEQEVG